MNTVAQQRQHRELVAWHEQKRAERLTRPPNRRARVVQSSDLFRVDMVKVGGDDGSETEQATWIYDIFRVGHDKPIATNVSLLDDRHDYKRQILGEIGPATSGLAYFNNDDELCIYHCNEDDLVGPCSNSKNGGDDPDMNPDKNPDGTPTEMNGGIFNVEFSSDVMDFVLVNPSEGEFIEVAVTIGGETTNQTFPAPDGTILFDGSGDATVLLTHISRNGLPRGQSTINVKR